MRYVRIYDLRDTKLWRNHNVLLTYMYIAAACNYKTQTLTRSLRSMAREINLTPSAVRCALDSLERAGIIEVRRMARETLVLLKNEWLEETPITTDALEILQQNAANIGKTLSAQPDTLAVWMQKFVDFQTLANKAWKNERDLCAHFAQWYLKNSGQRLQRQVETQVQQTRHEESNQQPQKTLKQQNAELAETWKKDVEEARRKAAAGDQDATDFLQQPYVLTAIKKYRL